MRAGSCCEELLLCCFLSVSPWGCSRAASYGALTCAGIGAVSGASMGGPSLMQLADLLLLPKICLFLQLPHPILKANCTLYICQVQNPILFLHIEHMLIKLIQYNNIVGLHWNKYSLKHLFFSTRPHLRHSHLTVCLLYVLDGFSWGWRLRTVRKQNIIQAFVIVLCF